MGRLAWLLTCLLIAPAGCVRAMEGYTSSPAAPADGARGGEPHAQVDGRRDLTGVVQGCPVGALLCDGFEDPLPGVWIIEGDGTIARVDSSQGKVHSGSYARQLSIGAGAAERAEAQSFDISPHVTSGLLSFRAYLYVVPPIASATLSLVELNCGNVGAKTVKTSIDVAGGIVKLLNGAGAHTTSTTSMPSGRWVCAELRVDLSSSPHTITALIDGSEVAKVAEPSACTSFATAKLQVWTETQPAVTVYFDDVIVAKGPIGCN